MKSVEARTRLVDVAREAGVSVTTASDALSNSPRVKGATKERVKQVARRLNYRPNRVAQDLVRRAPSSVTVMFSGPESLNFLSNPIFIELFRPVVETLNASGINVYTEVTTDLEEAERLASHAYGGSSAVIILIGTRLSDAVLESLSRTLPVPIITVVRRPLPGANVGVAVCNFEIGAMAAAHLLELGHRRIGYIGANPGVQLGEERLEGFRDQFASREILLDERWIRAGDFYQESGRLAMIEILELGEVTAVFAANDLMAIGALEACKERDVEVPGQMSILGCDNIPNLDLLSVPLSTIALPVREMGVLAARQAESILNGERPEAPVVLHAKLLLRESTAPLQAAQK